MLRANPQGIGVVTDRVPMKLPPLNQGEWLDRWLLGFSFLGMGLFLYFLNDNSMFFKSRYLRQGEKIGSVSQLSRDVRRRATDDFVWLPLSDLEAVYVGDSIFTGNKSSVSVRLTSGVELWIDPDSLVVLDRSESLTKLDLKFGNLRGNLGASGKSLLKLNVNNQDLDLEGKSVAFSLEKMQSSSTKLRVTEGQARLTEVKSKKQIKIAKQHQVSISRDVASIGNLSVLEEEPIFVRTEQWAENKNLWFSERQKLKFHWQAEGPIEYFKLIVSTRSDLSQPIINEKLKVNGFEWFPLFDEGSLYWRVNVYKKNSTKITLQSDIIQWNIGLLSAPEWINTLTPMILSPTSWVKPAGPETSPEIDPRLEWKSKIKTTSFRIEISKDPQFKEKGSFEVKQNRWTVPKLDLGKYYARVRSENVSRPPSLWSHTLIIDVTDLDPDGLVEPLILTKELETPMGGEPPVLRWEPQEKTTQYLVERSQDINFNTMVQSQRVDGVSLMISPGLTMGDSFFRVFPLSQKGRRGPVSKTMIWHARPPAPLWKYKDHLLSIAIPRNEAEQLLPFPDTPLQWTPWSARDPLQGRVEVIDKNLSEALPVKRVAAAQTKSKSKISMTKQKRGIPKAFVSSADIAKLLGVPVRFILESSMDAEFLTFDRKEVVTPNYILKALNPGVYYVRVRSVYQMSHKELNASAMTSKDQSSGSSNVVEVLSLPSRILKIEVYEMQKDGLAAPIIASKNLEGVLDGEKQQAEAQLKWNKQQSAVKYKVQVAESNDFDTIVAEKVADQNQTDLIVKKSGKYAIRVAGISAKNRTGPWSMPISWKVQIGAPQIIPLQTLFVALEKESAVIPPGVFSVKWHAASEIKQFQLELSESPQFSKLKLKETVKINTYNLKLMEPGQLYLRVRGLNEVGSSLTNYSKVEPVKYLVRKPLQSPTLVFPKDKVSYILSKKENPEVWLEWQGDQLADQYLIEFSSDRSFKKVLYSLKPKENRILLDHAAIRGKVFWRVKGLNSEQGLESSWSPSWSLSVVNIESDD